jgi:4-alpha-glucanotransferase
MPPFHFLKRRSGVLLHPTSLPSGKLEDAFRWLDFMAECGLEVWQVLPLGVPQAGLSPYQCLSAFAANPALTDPVPAPIDEDLQRSDFLKFCEQQFHWLDDYALFVAIKAQYENCHWVSWPAPLRNHEAMALAEINRSHAAELNAVKWQQFNLHLQWQKIRDYACSKNIALFGDMPIFVAHDSADVWACQDRFLLDDDGNPIQVTGVPPDYFSAEGQRWGNPHYDWEFMEHEGFQWWLDRLHHHFEWFDLVRIDHFRGMEASWMIYAESETAIDGYWQKVPGEKLLSKLQQEMQEIPLVAEDLGDITPEVTALKNQFNLPGMSVLQFSFDTFDDNPHKPENILPNTVVYTGTHDNDTTLGWFQSQEPDMQQHILHTLKIDDPQQVVETMIDTALQSRASLAVIPLQDFLGLDSSARMNTPGTIENNWQWSFSWEQLDSRELPDRILQWNRAANRLTGEAS